MMAEGGRSALLLLLLLGCVVGVVTAAFEPVQIPSWPTPQALASANAKAIITKLTRGLVSPDFLPPVPDSAAHEPSPDETPDQAKLRFTSVFGPRLVLVGGGMAAGKGCIGTWLNRFQPSPWASTTDPATKKIEVSKFYTEIAGREVSPLYKENEAGVKNILMIDPDEIKPEFPEFKLLKNYLQEKGDDRWRCVPGWFHRASSLLTDKLFTYGLQQRFNILWDASFQDSNWDIIDRVQGLTGKPEPPLSPDELPDELPSHAPLPKRGGNDNDDEDEDGEEDEPKKYKVLMLGATKSIVEAAEGNLKRSLVNGRLVPLETLVNSHYGYAYAVFNDQARSAWVDRVHQLMLFNTAACSPEHQKPDMFFYASNSFPWDDPEVELGFERSQFALREDMLGAFKPLLKGEVPSKAVDDPDEVPDEQSPGTKRPRTEQEVQARVQARVEFFAAHQSSFTRKMMDEFGEALVQQYEDYKKIQCDDIEFKFAGARNPDDRDTTIFDYYIAAANLKVLQDKKDQDELSPKEAQLLAALVDRVEQLTETLTEAKYAPYRIVEGYHAYSDKYPVIAQQSSQVKKEGEEEEYDLDEEEEEVQQQSKSSGQEE